MKIFKLLRLKLEKWGYAIVFFLISLSLFCICIPSYAQKGKGGKTAVEKKQVTEEQKEEDKKEVEVSSVEPSKPPEELQKEKNAELHFNRGVEFFQEGMISAALAEFQKSYSEYSHWAVLYNVGVCYYRLGKYEEALEVFDKYIKEGGENIPVERRFAVEKIKVKMAGSFGNIKIDYKDPGLEAIIDAKKVYNSPFETPISVPAGIHTVYLYKEGHYPLIREIFVAIGETVQVPVNLKKTPLMGSLVEDANFMAKIGLDKKFYKYEVAGWSLLGAAGFLSIGVIVSGAITYKLKQDQTFKLIECGGGKLSREDCPEAYDIGDKGDKWKWATNGLAISAGAFLIASITIWVIRKEKIKRSVQKLALLSENQGKIGFNLKVGPEWGFLIIW